MSVSLLTGRMQSVLATQAALFAAGLSAGAIPMAVAVQWVLKDGVGHAGAIVYAASVNTKFDSDAKRYRFHSTSLLTLADAVAVMMPLVPQHFFLLASISSATSSIANLVQVSARARIMSSFAVQGNLADCVRAGQTQGKLMSLVGTGAGAGLSWVIGPDPLHVLCAMGPLAAVSLYAMFESSRVVVLRTLNVQRSERVFVDIIAALDAAAAGNNAAGNAAVDGERAGDSGMGTTAVLVAPTPDEVAHDETFVLPYASVAPGQMMLQPLFPPAAAASAPLLAVLAPLGRLSPLGSAGEGSGADATSIGEALPALKAAIRGRAFPPAADDGGDPSSGGGGCSWRARWCDGYAIAACVTPADQSVRVAVWHDAKSGPAEQMRAVWHATLLRTRWESAAHLDAHAIDARIDAASDAVRASWPEVHAALMAAGWDMSKAHLDGDGGCVELV